MDRKRVARQAKAPQVGPDDRRIGDHGDESAFPRSAVGSLEHVHFRMGDNLLPEARVGRIATQLDMARYGVAGVYIFGSTKNATAGPGSDIDLLIHFRGTHFQREKLNQWLDGWSLCLDEMNYMRTGYRSSGLLDVHIVTDAARPLPMQLD